MIIFSFFLVERTASPSSLLFGHAQGGFLDMVDFHTFLQDVLETGGIDMGTSQVKFLNIRSHRLMLVKHLNRFLIKKYNAVFLFQTQKNVRQCLCYSQDLIAYMRLVQINTFC